MPSTTRRGFLFGTSALALCLAAGAAPGQIPAGAARPAGGIQLGFAGPDTLLLTIEARALMVPPPGPVPPRAEVVFSPSFTDRISGAGTVDGVPAMLSGAEHLRAPRQARPWPMAAPGDLSLIGSEAGPLDDPALWSVRIGGSIAGVRQVFRRTSPIATERVEPRTFVHDRRHVVALVLDRPVPEGAEVAAAGPAGIAAVALRTPDLWSEAVHVCQTGYAAGGPKKGYAGLWLGQDRTGTAGSTDAALAGGPEWRLIGPGGVAAQGRMRLAKPAEQPHRKDENFNGCDIWEADFGEVSAEGAYRLEVAGLGASYPFRIAPNPVAETLRLSARFLYHKRSGIAITDPHGEGITRPRNGHPDDGLTVWQTALQLGGTSEGYGGPSPFEALSAHPVGGPPVEGPDVPPASPHPRAWGGWHDAADWDRRIQHAETVATLAEIVELFESARALDLNLPESGRPFADGAVLARKDADDLGDGRTVLPDLIHEALWGLSLWRRTQRSDGGILGGVEYSLDWILGSVSWNPIQRTYAYAPEPWAAYLFAHGAAKLGHVIAEVCGDRVLGRALAREALRAWDWAEAQWPQALAAAEGKVSRQDDPEEGVPASLVRARTAAAGSLYRATGDPGARRAFEAVNPFLPRGEAGRMETRRGVYTIASLDYLRAGEEGRPVDAEIAARIRRWAEAALRRSHRLGRDFGLHGSAAYPRGRGWLRFGPGSNWTASLAGLALAAGRRDDPQVLPAVLEGMWFALGCNPANVSFVIGQGTRQFGDPLQIDRSGLPPVPGTLVFGVAGGQMHHWERTRIAPALYPAEQEAWPAYAQIYESSAVAICAEHGVRGNMIEWLYACAFAHDLLSRSGG